MDSEISRNVMICDDWMNNDLPDECIDFIFVDLPFNIDIGKRTQTRAKGFDGHSYVDDSDPFDYYIMLRQWFWEARRVLKPEGSIVMFSGWNGLRVVLQAAGESGLGFLQGHCIIKYPFGVFTKKRYVSSHYHALWYTKSDKKWTFNKTKNYMEDVWEAKREYKSKELGHPCATTSAWIKDFILVHSNPGDLVLDFCMGVGGTAIACLDTGRDYIGYEIVPEYVESANRRVEEWKRDKLHHLST